MKNKTLFLLLAVRAGLLSCHKDSGSSSNTNGHRLSRYEEEGISYEMQYGPTGQVTKFLFSNGGTGSYLNLQTTQLFRNRAGIITEMIDAWPGADSALNPSDTTIGMPHINAWCSPNNVNSALAIDIQSPVSTFSMKRNFVYSSSGFPDSSTDQWVATLYAQPSAAATRYYY